MEKMMAKKIMVSTITAKIVPMMNPTLRRRACAALGLLACPAFSDFLLNVDMIECIRRDICQIVYASDEAVLIAADGGWYGEILGNGSW